jgi:hypothetical protein
MAAIAVDRRTMARSQRLCTGDDLSAEALAKAGPKPPCKRGA